ncbi:hypothetical protein JW905_18050 [bacterium]|nr:hypothetical protein [candidate division CSSED10-310 bacterium]
MAVEKVHLKVNGVEIRMNRFVREVVGGIVLAVVRQLTLDEKPKRIELDLELGE